MESLVVRDEPIPDLLVVARLGSVIPTIDLVESGGYDLWYDATTVGADLVVECWISHGPRADDPTFDPRPGDGVSVGDDEEAPFRARVVRRDGDRVAVQVELADASHAVA